MSAGDGPVVSSARYAVPRPAAIVVFGDDGQTEEPDTARAMATQARMLGIAVYAIGFGADLGEGLLVDVAGARDRYRFDPTAAEMVALYDEIAGATR